MKITDNETALKMKPERFEKIQYIEYGGMKLNY